MATMSCLLLVSCTEQPAVSLHKITYCSRLCQKTDDCCTKPPCTGTYCFNGSCLNRPGCAKEADCDYMRTANKEVKCVLLSTGASGEEGVCTLSCNGNTDCEDKTHTCLEITYLGRQLRTCRQACSKDSDCKSHQRCVDGTYCDFRCENDTDCTGDGHHVCDRKLGRCMCTTDEVCQKELKALYGSGKYACRTFSIQN